MNPRRKPRSPARSPTAGLLLILAVAVVVGVCAGTYLGRHVTIPGSTGTPPPGSAHESLPRAPEADQPAGQAVRSARGAVPAPSPGQPAEPKAASGAVAQQPQRPAHETPPSKPRRRASAYSGEIAHTDSSTLVALTLDAGASGKPTPDILDALKSAGLRVTFFLTGKWCEQNEALVKRMHDEGHEIANHTYSHPDLRKMSDDAIREQLAKVDEIVLRITGAQCAPYFRPPYGARDKRVLRIASEQGYTSIYWSLDSWDAFKKGITSDEIKERVLERIQGGDIVLMHCGSRATADALPDLNSTLQSRGFRVVTVSELILSRRPDNPG